MKNIKTYNNYIKELNQSTWDSAIQKARDLGQENLAKKFHDHKPQSEWLERRNKNLELKIRDSYTFDFYLYTVTEMDSNRDFEIEDIIPLKVDDMILHDEDAFSFVFGFENEKEIFKKYDIDIDEDEAIIPSFVRLDKDLNFEDLYNDKNKFSNKKSVLKFFEMLHKIYLLQDPNRVKKAIASINKSEITASDKGGDFFEFVNNHFGSWEGLKQKINIRKFYDVFK